MRNDSFERKKYSNKELKKLARSEELFEKAKRLIPGGVNSPVRAFQPYPFFTETPVYDYRTVKTADTAKFMTYQAKLLQKGIFIPPSQFETCFLLCVHSQQDINHTVEVAKTILSEQGNLSKTKSLTQTLFWGIQHGEL